MRSEDSCDIPENIIYRNKNITTMNKKGPKTSFLIESLLANKSSSESFEDTKHSER